MGYSVLDLKNAFEVREEWMEKPIIDFLEDEIKRKEYKNLIKVAQGATGIGKSYFIRNVLIPKILKTKSFVLYLAPQTENIPELDFMRSQGNGGYTFTRKAEFVPSMLEKGMKVVLGITWGCIGNNSEKWEKIRGELLKLSDKSAWIIDECHSWLGVSAQDYYHEVIGHRTPKFGATAMNFCKETMALGNDLVFGFTATPTKQHRGFVGEQCYVMLNKWCPVRERFLMTKSSKEYNEYNGFDMLRDPVSGPRAVINHDRAFNALDKYVNTHHISNIRKLMELSKYDQNIKPKLSSLIAAGGTNNSRLAIHVDDAVSKLRYILSNSGAYQNIGNYIGVLTDTKTGFYDLEGNFTKAEEQLVLSATNNPNEDCQFLVVNNKGKAGIDVFNLTGICSLRIREPSQNDCTELTRQIIGRCTRLNSGHGNILHQEYNYDMEKMLRNYCKDNPYVSKQVFLETISIANTFRFDYPSTPQGHWDLSKTEFERDYAANWDSISDVVRTLIFSEELCDKCPLHSSFNFQEDDNFGPLNELFAS